MKILAHSGCKNKGNLDKKTLICKGCGQKPSGDKVTLVKYKDEVKDRNKKRYNSHVLRMWHEINNPNLFYKRTHYGYSRG